MSLGYLGKNDVIRLTEGKKGGEFVQLKFHWNKMEIFLFILQKPRYFLLITTVFCYVISPLSLKRHLSLRLMLLRMEHIMLHPSYRETRHPGRPSGESVGSGEKARQRFSGKGGRAPGYRPLRNHFQTIKLVGHKNALYYCAQSLNSISWVLFVCSYTTAIVSSYSFGLWTKEIQAVSKLSVWYKPRPWIPKYYCLPEN